MAMDMSKSAPGARVAPPRPPGRGTRGTAGLPAAARERTRPLAAAGAPAQLTRHACSHNQQRQYAQDHRQLECIRRCMKERPRISQCICGDIPGAGPSSSRSNTAARSGRTAFPGATAGARPRTFCLGAGCGLLHAKQKASQCEAVLDWWRVKDARTHAHPPPLRF